MYDIVYSVGTNRHDEARYVLRGVPAAKLVARIAGMQAKGKVIYSIQRTTEL